MRTAENSWYEEYSGAAVQIACIAGTTSEISDTLFSQDRKQIFAQESWPTLLACCLRRRMQ